MPSEKLVRFSITVPEDLLSEFETAYYAENRPNRSESVRSLMREYLSGERWRCSGGEICATITIVYDHHLPEITRSLTSAQHDSGDVIICATHVHLNHHTCLECVITKGNSQDIQKLVEALRKIRGIKSLSVNVTTEI
ncbi:MAG: nickel-responsive transcriptional regulator NikR [Synergistaceae bacterium]|nr:nickel-responsive transcriptional regulator NikR [Synergistaceae bacterium]MBQ4432176.1 nickel-responsive transcriptional regulator NikR [Synergistaceae bacterium]MBQ7170634.1 nickel-responsive transcriptional regulator NikR [Synergistaceae bacterium]